MDVTKGTAVVSTGTPDGLQLEAINRQAKGNLTAEQVYVFSVRLCDDQVDRDYERFDTAALPALAKLFVGKTGILDHKWSSDSQVARIFQTQVVQEDGISYIKAWAYILRGERADGVIADIEAGIKKEVSVGCAMGRAVCSICGGDYGSCGHEKGEHYDGQLCCSILKEPMDAYEFSFVAVPAQPAAGVLKGMGGKQPCLKELADEFGAQAEYRKLFQDALLGQQYRKELEEDVVRLCLALDLGAEYDTLRGIVCHAAHGDLLGLRKALQGKMQEMYPVRSQLHPAQSGEAAIESGFLI